MEITDVYKCSGCNAVTIEGISDEGEQFSNSMKLKAFRENFKGIRIKRTLASCNYCVNHWGVDLCGCGSGQKVGKCKNDYYECQNKIPAQQLFEMKDSTPKFGFEKSLRMCLN